MKPILATALLCSLVPVFAGYSIATASPSKAADSEWVSLFDGKTLEGWVQRDGKAPYEVRDGAIVGSSVQKSPNTFLCTEQTFADFELEFEVKVGPVNSGVMIRSLAEKPDKKGGTQTRVNGPQVELEHSPGQTGYIYGAAMGGGWRSPEPRGKDRSLREHSALMNDDWNQVRILAEGPRIRTWINAQLIADLTDEAAYASHPEGFLGLQIHSHKVDGDEVEWRNIRIRELNTAAK